MHAQKLRTSGANIAGLKTDTRREHAALHCRSEPCIAHRLVFSACMSNSRMWCTGQRLKRGNQCVLPHRSLSNNCLPISLKYVRNANVQFEWLKNALRSRVGSSSTMTNVVANIYTFPVKFVRRLQHNRGINIALVCRAILRLAYYCNIAMCLRVSRQVESPT